MLINGVGREMYMHICMEACVEMGLYGSMCGDGGCMEACVVMGVVLKHVW